VEESRRYCALAIGDENRCGRGLKIQRTSSSSTPSPSPLFYVRSATGAHNQELVGAPDQGAGSGGPPETKSLAVGRPLGSIQQTENGTVSVHLILPSISSCQPSMINQNERYEYISSMNKSTYKLGVICK
jgi:hypothetical protein